MLKRSVVRESVSMLVHYMGGDVEKAAEHVDVSVEKLEEAVSDGAHSLTLEEAQRIRDEAYRLDDVVEARLAEGSG